MTKLLSALKINFIPIKKQSTVDNRQSDNVSNKIVINEKEEEIELCLSITNNTNEQNILKDIFEVFLKALF